VLLGNIRYECDSGCESNWCECDKKVEVGLLDLSMNMR
jgi:hypothetical protein